MVENLFAILSRPPSLWRPNFPVPAWAYPLGPQFVLEPFGVHALEVFRYYEKPESLELPIPDGPVPAQTVRQLVSDYHSLTELYEDIETLFCDLLDARVIQGRNPNRVVNEHFGFNLTLDPVVVGQHSEYIRQIIGQILEEGEGVGEETPPLGSHFMAFQEILTEVTAGKFFPGVEEFALPCVPNPPRRH